jgi:hypothetical protein
MSLSQFAINNAKPQDRPYLLSDGDGLHLRIHPKGGRQWRLGQQADGVMLFLHNRRFNGVEATEGSRAKREQKRKKRKTRSR